MNSTDKYKWADSRELAIESECFETPEWAVEAILEKEILTKMVLDPCCGTGILSEAAKVAGYDVLPLDLNDWGYGISGINFLEMQTLINEAARFDQYSVLMNPPFSKACEFVDRAKKLGVRKILCFQRFAWWEGALDKGKKRGRWWANNPPNRIYICGERANCWRVDIPPEGRGSSSPTAHAWFVWEDSHPPGTLIGHVYK